MNWIIKFGIIVMALSVIDGRSKYYDGDERPYKFGFKLDGNQHRHEEKDENGIINGEFGFITADGIYHVTVYMTDEDGNYKVLSMKNIKVADFIQKDSETETITTTTRTPFEDLRNAKALPGFISDKNKLEKIQEYMTTIAMREMFSIQTTPETPSTVATFVDEPVKTVEGCSNCKIPVPPPIFNNFGSALTEKPRSKSLNFESHEDISNFARSNDNNGFVSHGLSSGVFTGGFNNQPNNKPTNGFTSPGLTSGVALNGPNSHQNNGLTSGFVTNGPIEARPPHDNDAVYFPEDRGIRKLVDDVRNNPLFTIDDQQSLTKQHADQHSHTAPVTLNNMPLMEQLVNGLLYRFNYTVDFHGHNEQGDRAGNKEGSYNFIGRDGLRRIVDYTANDKGFASKFRIESVPAEKQINVDTEREAALRGYEFVWYN